MEHATDTNAVYAQALKGVSFPATRDQLVERAKANNAPQYVIEVISKMPDDDTYNTMPDVFVNTRVGKDAVANEEKHGMKNG